MNSVVVAILGGLSMASAQIDRVRVETPPWEYDYPYRGTLSVMYMEPELVQFVCRAGFGKTAGAKVPSHIRILACAGVYEDMSVCEVVMPHKHFYSEDLWWAIWRHEMAHCNGWSH